MNTTLSIIIPVFNEQEIIINFIECLLKLSFREPVEIIISDGEKGGITLGALGHRYDHDPRIIKTLSKKGRGPQMNQGVSVSTGKVLWFLHADAAIDQHCLDLIYDLISEQILGKTGSQEAVPWDGSCVYGAFDLIIASEKPAFRLIEAVASLRSRLTGIPYGDQGIFMTRFLFNRIGGFSEIPIMEDVEIMERIKKMGCQPVIFNHGILTSPRRWERQGIIYTTLRNWLLFTLYQLGVSPQSLVKYY